MRQTREEIQVFSLTLFWLEKLIWNELLKYVTVLPTRSLTVSLKQFAVTCFYTKPVAQMLCGWRSHTLDVRLGSVQFISVDGIEPSQESELTACYVPKV